MHTGVHRQSRAEERVAKMNTSGTRMIGRDGSPSRPNRQPGVLFRKYVGICRRGFWRFSRRKRSACIRCDTGRGSNAENRQKPPDPSGCAENGPAPTLHLSRRSQRTCSFDAPWRRAILRAANAYVFPEQDTGGRLGEASLPLHE
jgi:hypothetical protein